MAKLSAERSVEEEQIEKDRFLKEKDIARTRSIETTQKSTGRKALNWPTRIVKLQLQKNPRKNPSPKRKPTKPYP